jgi:uncharacterized protein
MNLIDTLRFCKDATSLNGSLAPSDLPRLAAEVLPESNFLVTWHAQGESPDVLALSLQAKVQMRCQRCLGALEESIDVNYGFRFVKDEVTAQAEDEASDEVDHLVHAKQFDLQELIEDEMLMALPFVSLHDEDLHGGCPASPTANYVHKEQKPNPFAALAGLKIKNMA